MREDAIDTTDKNPFAKAEPGRAETCKDAADWLAEPDEPSNPLVSGFIESGEVFVIVGQAKAGKSLVALQMALCIALGVPFIGKKCARRKVYIANLEVSERQYKKRLRRICKGLDANPANLRGWLFIDNMKGETASWNTALDKCKAHRCEVAIIDPFYQIAHIAETDEVQCLEAVEAMKAFSNADITLGIVFHSPKGFSGDRQLIDMISGSSILARFPESVIGLLNHASEKTTRVIDAVLRNYPPPEPFTVSIGEGVLELAPSIAPEVATARNAWKRAQPTHTTVDILPYVDTVISEAREDAKRGGEVFRGIKKYALVERIRNKIRAEHKHPIGRDPMADLIDGLPTSKYTITRKTADGVLIGTKEDMAWYTKR